MEAETVEGAEASSVETEDVNVGDLGESEAPEGDEPEVSESETYVVTIDGEEVEVSLDDALKGYMRQSDYTRKTQEVAQQRERLEFAERVLQTIETDPRTALQALAKAYAAEDLFSSNVPAAEEVDDEADLDPLERQVRDQQRWIEEQEARSFEQHVNSHLDRLHGQFGEFDDVEFINFMVDRGIADFDDAAKVFVYDRVMGQARRQKADAAARAAKEGMTPVAGGSRVAAGTTTSGGTEPIRSVRAAFEAAVREHSR